MRPLPQPIPDWTATTPLPNPRPLPTPIVANPIGVIRPPAQGVSCPGIRPSEQTCPTLNYLVAPALNFCGVNAQGHRRGFDLACSACKDRSIRFYYNCPCSRIGQDIDRPQPVRPPVLQQRVCSVDRQCQQWEFCLERKCTDRCATMRCAGNCVRGQCQPVRRT